MKRFKRYLVVGLIGLVMMASAQAILPIAAAVVWLGGAVTANASLVTAVEASLYIHAAGYAIYSIFFANKGADGKPTGPAVEVKLNPNASRSNPDPTKFDDPAPGARDVTPKATFAASGGSGQKTYAGQVLADGQVATYQAPANSYFSHAGSGCAGGDSTSTAICGAKAPGGIMASCESTVSSGWHCGYGAAWNDGGGGFKLDVRQFYDGAGGGSNYYGVVTVIQAQGTTACGSGSAGVSGACTTYYKDNGGSNCPPGYTATGGTCNLTDPSKVKKPDTTPCEILRTPSGLQLDAANPNCAGIQTQGNVIQPTPDQAVSFNADNSVSISNPSGQTTLQLGAANADGSVQVTGASRSGSPSAYVPGSTSGGSTACGGVGQSPCSGTAPVAGGGGGSCGGPGQAACSIDDSGFNGKALDMGTANGALDQHSNDRIGLFDKAKQSVVAPAWGWTLPITSTACQPLVYGSMRTLNFKLDWCKYLPLIQQAISFLAYCFTALYLFQLVFAAPKEGAK